MKPMISLFGFDFLVLLEQVSIVKILSITVIFFLLLLVLGIRKSYKLKQENERLSKATPADAEEGNKTYKDFREGHLYDNK